MNHTEMDAEKILAILETNPENPYKRMIKNVRWISPAEVPYLFHTASSDRINEVSPALCQSFDYRIEGKNIPVTYALPWIHVNRVRGASEIWKPIRKEAKEMTGMPYTYLTIGDENNEKGQIRMGSTMLDQYLLAARNSGQVFEVDLLEIKADGQTKKLQEYISFKDLPVIDAYKYTNHSPLGVKVGGAIETHLPIDIANPNSTGFYSFEKYLSSLRYSAHRTLMTEIGNILVGQNPNEVMKGVFDQLMKENRKALLNVNRENRKRIFAVLKPN